MEHPSFALPHRAVYESPRVESFEIAAERGFAQSGGLNGGVLTEEDYENNTTKNLYTGGLYEEEW